MNEATSMPADRPVRRAIALACVAGVLPFLILACFGTPFADDFLLANTVRQFGVLGNVEHWYQRYTGRFAGIYVLGIAVHAGIMQTGYWVLPFLSLLTFVMALAWLLRSQPLLRLRWRESLVAAGAGTAIYVVTMPSFVEGMCWLNGVAAYHTGVIALLLLFAAIFSTTTSHRMGIGPHVDTAPDLHAQTHIRARTRTNVTRAVLCALLAFITPGFNETAMLAAGLFLLIGIIATFRRNRAMCVLMLISLIALGVGGATNVLAPGNYNRMADLPESRNLGLSLSHGIGMTFAYFFRWLANPAIIGAMVLLMPVLAARMKDVTLSWPRKRMVMVAILGCMALLFAVLFLGYWAKGQNAPRRVQNVLYLVHLAAWFIVVLIALAGRREIAWPAWLSAHRVKLGVVLLAVGVFGVSRWPRAVIDLAHLPAHLNELAERDRHIAEQLQAGQRDLIVPAESRELRTLSYHAMKVDDPAWVMESFAEWIGARSIKIVPRKSARR